MECGIVKGEKAGLCRQSCVTSDRWLWLAKPWFSHLQTGILIPSSQGLLKKLQNKGWSHHISILLLLFPKSSKFLDFSRIVKKAHCLTPEGWPAQVGCCFRKLSKAALESRLQKLPGTAPQVSSVLELLHCLLILTHQQHLGLSLSPQMWVVVLALISVSHYPGAPSLSHTVSDPNPPRHFHPHKQDPNLQWFTDTPYSVQRPHITWGWKQQGRGARWWIF